MSFLDRFKKEKEKPAPKPKKKPEKKVEKKPEKKLKKKPIKKLEEKKVQPKEEKGQPKEKKAEPKKEVKERALKVEIHRILKEPHITEKATDLGEEGKYVFRIYPRANKVEVKKAVENLYGVDVLTVRIIKVPSKSRRLGRTMGQRKGYKKAIVKVKKGQKIELLPR